jgi:hypothetical protein
MPSGPAEVQDACHSTTPVKATTWRLSRHDIVSTPLWDGRVAGLPVTDADDRAVELRVLASARTAPAAFDLRGVIRGKLIDCLAREHPYVLPRRRQDATAENTPVSAEQIETPQTQIGRRGR